VRHLVPTLALVALGVILLVESASVAAQEAIEVRDQRVANRFPEGLEFSLLVQSDAEVENVRLRYRVLPDGANVSVRPDCSTSAVVNCSTIVGRARSELLLPGVQIAYSWLIEDAAGGQLQTEEEVYFFQDDRFEWQEMTTANLTAYYYSGDEARVATILEIGAASMAQISALLGTTVDFPVRLWVYETAIEMQPAIVSSDSDTSITLGEVYYSDTAAVSLDSSQPLDIVRHELAHIVVGAATMDHLRGVPTWLNEGTAVYAQNARLPGFDEALAVAIRRDRALPFSSLSSASLTSTETSLFYAQSWSVVTYLVDTYGAEKFRELYAAFARADTDGALEATYGFDLAGLEDEWRASVGLPPVERAGASGAQAATATPPPQAAGSTDDDQPSAPPEAASAGDDGGSGISVTLIVGLLTAVLAVAILALGLVVARKQGGASS
jgi:hypothetical protein